MPLNTRRRTVPCMSAFLCKTDGSSFPSPTPDAVFRKRNRTYSSKNSSAQAMFRVPKETDSDSSLPKAPSKHREELLNLKAFRKKERHFWSHCRYPHPRNHQRDDAEFYGQPPVRTQISQCRFPQKKRRTYNKCICRHRRFDRGNQRCFSERHRSL